MADNKNCSTCIFQRFSLDAEDKIGYYCHIHWIQQCNDLSDYITTKEGHFVDKDGEVVSPEYVESKLFPKIVK